MTVEPIDSEELWRRVGLGELRLALGEVHGLSVVFEQAVQQLPACTQCARNSFLEEVHRSGAQLSRQAASLSVLAETLKVAASSALAAAEDLASQPPTPCRCGGNPCTCHG